MPAEHHTTSFTLDYSPTDGDATITHGEVDVTGSIVADLIADLETAEKKLIELGIAIPENQYDWHPEGARSLRKLLLHIASNNYLLPAALGFTPDPATGVTTDNNTAAAFEERRLSKDLVIAELRKSFAFVKHSLQSATPASMSAPATLFGQRFTGQFVWVLLVTHIHEHLGQAIAYARARGVKPAWS